MESNKNLALIRMHPFRLSNWKDHNYILEKDRQWNPICYEVFMKRDRPCNPCPTMRVCATGKIERFESTNPNRIMSI